MVPSVTTNEVFVLRFVYISLCANIFFSVSLRTVRDSPAFCLARESFEFVINTILKFNDLFICVCVREFVGLCVRARACV